MTEELGKIERPAVEEFKKGRKLYFVPLILSIGDNDLELDLHIGKYWEQVEAQLDNLESKLGKVSCVFHELVPAGSENGLKTIETICKDSHKITLNEIGKGAKLLSFEDGDILFEFMDWGRCLSIGIQSQKVFNEIYEAYTRVQKLRNETIARKIDEALVNDETGIIFMREGHYIQFPSDIQVFYVSPPGLDELKRWLRERDAEAEKKMDKSSEDKNKEKSPGS
jgi:hypothetical protein